MRRTHPSQLTLSDVLMVSRPFWWIATAAPFAVGFFTVRGVAVTWPLVVGVVYFSVAYGLLINGTNQVFDPEGALRQPYTRGIVLASAKRRALLLVTLALNVPFWLYFVVMGGSGVIVWLLAMLYAVAAFSARGIRYKEVPGLDAITNAFIYTSPFIFGVLFADGNDFWLPAFGAFFIWAVAGYAFAALQTAQADRAARVDTLATKLGADGTLMLCLGSYLVAAVLPVVYYGWRGVFVGAVLLWYVALVLTTLPFKRNTGHIVFRKAWRILTWLNYVTGILLVLYVLLLHRLS